MRIKYLPILFFLTLLFVSSTFGGNSHNLLRIASNSKISGFTIWSVKSGKSYKDLRCLVSKHTEMGHQLDIFEANTDKVIYSFKPGDNFVGMIPTADGGGDLFTIWTGGSAYHFNLFSYQNHKIRLIFEGGGRMFPELVHVSKDEKPAIIVVTDMIPNKEGIMQPNNAEIYRWNGKEYYQHKVTSWEDRLKVLPQ